MTAPAPTPLCASCSLSPARIGDQCYICIVRERDELRQQVAQLTSDLKRQRAAYARLREGLRRVSAAVMNAENGTPSAGIVERGAGGDR